MLHGGAEGPDPQPGDGPGGATFPCRISAKPYIVTRRSRRPSRCPPPGRAGRRNLGPRPAGISHRHGRDAVRPLQGPGSRHRRGAVGPYSPGYLMTDETTGAADEPEVPAEVEAYDDGSADYG